MFCFKAGGIAMVRVSRTVRRTLWQATKFVNLKCVLLSEHTLGDFARDRSASVAVRQYHSTTTVLRAERDQR